MAREKKVQEAQPIVAEKTPVKKKSPKKKKVVEETKVTKAPSSGNEVIDEGTLMLEVWQEDASNSGTEKKNKFIELFGQERFAEIFGKDYLKEMEEPLDAPEEKSILTLDEILRNMPSDSERDDDDDCEAEKTVPNEILDKFDKDLEAKGLGDDYFQKKEEQLKEMELEHENHEFEIDKMLDEEN